MKIFKVAVLILLSGWIFLPLTGCGGGYGNIPAASVLASGRITLSWNEIPGAASYNIYISTSPGVTKLNSYKIPAASTPVTLTDLEPGTTYYFMVTVFNDSGESRTSKEISFTVTEAEGLIDFGDLLEKSGPDEKPAESAAMAAAPAPAAETVVTLESTALPAAPSPAAEKVVTKSAPQTKVTQKDKSGTRDVTLAWDNVPNATSYNIYWRDKPGVTRQNGTKVANVKNPHKLKGLTKGKKYYFVVTAVNASGESKESDEFAFTVGQ